MEKTFTATASVAIDAAPARIWEVLTTASLIKKYLFGTDVITNWMEGEPIEYYGEYGNKKYHDKGIIQKFVPEKVLQTTYLSSMSGKEDIPENYHLVTYQISPDAGNQTVLTIIQDNIATEAEKEHAAQNWEMVLKKLKAVAES